MGYKLKEITARRTKFKTRLSLRMLHQK